ncbi:Synapse-associated protein 1 [Caligus rogercresseyi]|uniref:Synapse-associated protein 1 n=1 Tax=Caligus rogercresseyi TaxID=217165 RepID=A0A7T8GUU1_CALRO|nr:Synapse-associated protein 1 [Caligus rogercresseyi]
MTEEETSVPPAEAPEVVPAEKSMEQDLKEKVGAGAQVLGSFFGSAWSKAAERSSFFSFATGPDDGEEEPLDPKDLSESPKKEKKAEIEDPEDEETDPLSYFLLLPCARLDSRRVAPRMN